MRIGILTYYNVHNHGALLQANALKTVLKSLGHDSEFLSFVRNYDMIAPEQVSKYKIGVGSLKFYVAYLFEKGVLNILYNLRKNQILSAYREKNLPILHSYDAFDGDAVIIGSDEVFSMEIGVNPFFYGYGLQPKRILSYAGCFGPTTLRDIEKAGKTEFVADGLKKMTAISVRDMNSGNIVSELTGTIPELVCDPVILYGYQKEMTVFKPNIKNYILIYSYDRNMNDKEEVQTIRKYAREHSLSILSVGYYHSWAKNIEATPEMLLGWMKNAALVITDTFHGAVMSLICNTQMVVKLRGNQNKLGYLMNEYELSSRVVSNFSQLEIVAEKQVDFVHVNKIIAERRAKSMEYLKRALES